MNKDVVKIQQAIFNFILNRAESKKDVLSELENVLCVSQSSVYKRIQGSKLLDIEELQILIERFQIPTSLIMPITNNDLMLSCPSLTTSTSDMNTYLERIIHQLEQTAAAASTVTYLSTDMPFFYYFLFKEIAWFKLYTFRNSNSDKLISQLPKIDFAAITSTDEMKFDRIKYLFSQIDSVELWTSNVYTVTVSQIKYFVKSKLFRHENDVLLLMDRLYESIEIIERAVCNNNKGYLLSNNSAGGSLDLSYNDFNRFNPLIVASAGDLKELYVTYNLPHFLTCHDERFIAYTELWIGRIKKKSHPVTFASEFNQISFFENIKARISLEKEIIEKMLFR